MSMTRRQALCAAALPLLGGKAFAQNTELARIVNGFAVGGGNVLQVVCDLTIAKESAVFRQVGPMVGSFDAGYGSSLLARQAGD